MSSLRISTTVPAVRPSGPSALRTRSLCFFLGFSAMNSSAARALPASHAGAGPDASGPSKPLPA